MAFHDHVSVREAQEVIVDVNVNAWEDSLREGAIRVDVPDESAAIRAKQQPSTPVLMIRKCAVDSEDSTARAQQCG